MSARQLRTEMEIDAPAERVWAVLTDFASWDQWNPTLFKANGNPVVGTEIRMKLRLGRLTVPMRQQVRVLEPPYVLVWRSKQLVPAAALDVVRHFVIEPLGDDRCRLIQSEDTTGFLASREVALLGRTIERGYENLGRALAARVAGTGD